MYINYSGGLSIYTLMVANKFISYLVYIYRYFIYVHVQLRRESNTAMDASNRRYCTDR